jgi:hypothetical protein
MRSNTSQKNTCNKKNLRFRRWVAGCLGAFAAGMLGVTAARSEYIFVVIDLNKPYTPMVFAQPAGGGGGGVGGPGGGGVGGGGMGKGGGGMGMGMGMGGAGAGGGMGMGMGMGAGGGMGMGMGMGGAGGGMGMGMGMGMGAGGGMGMGMGMGGAGGGMGMPGGGDGSMGGMMEGASVPDLLFAVVEINDPKKDNRLLGFQLPGTNVRRVTTNRGEAIVIQTPSNPVGLERLVDDTMQSMPPVAQRLISFKTTLANRPRAEQVIEGGRWAVEHGLYEEFINLINDKDSKVVALPQAQAWKKSEAALKGPIASSREIDAIKGRFPTARQRVDGEFCTILTEVDPQNLGPVQDAAAMVDKQVKLLYAWFALQGQAFPALPAKLVLVVLDKTELPTLENRFDDVHGYTSPRLGGYSVMSLKNVDPKLRQLSSRLDQYARTGWDLRGLQKLADKSYPPFIENNAINGTKLGDLAYVSSMNLLREALQLEERRAAAGFVVATQALPRLLGLGEAVKPPAWVEYGLGADFSTPAGTPWTVMGGVNTLHLPVYKELVKAKKLDAPEVTLRSVVTDGYFRRSAEFHQDKNLHSKARATAWGVTHFLLHKYSGDFSKYMAELNKLPRDLEFTEEQLWGCFQRAFLLNKGKTEALALKDLANECDVYLRQAKVEGERIFTLLRLSQEELGLDKTAMKDGKAKAMREANGILFSSSAMIQEAQKAASTLGSGGGTGGGGGAGGLGGSAGGGDGLER